MKVVNPGIDMTVNFGSSANIELIARMEQAMKDDATVEFTYDGKVRLVEVHAIGTSTKDGSLVMRGFQTQGVASRPLPQWTLFSVAKIEGLVVNDAAAGDRSLAPREGYAQGDKQMATILAELAL